MSAVILVLQNPFFTRPHPDGAFVLDGVPAGTYELRVFRLDERERSTSITVPAQGQVTAVIP